MSSFLVVFEAAAMLTARFRSNSALCATRAGARPAPTVSPRCNSNYLEETSSLEAAAMLTARFRLNTGLSAGRAGVNPAPTVSSRCNINFLDKI